MGSVVVDRSEPGVAIVMLEGEHELYGAMKLQRQVQALIDEGVSFVIVDLTQATFLDSSIVSVLLQTRREAREARIGFSLIVDDTTGESVRRMFEITGLDTILPIVESRKAALARAS